MDLKPYPLETIFGRIMSPFERFLKQTTAGGIVLIGTTVFTILFANTPWGGWIHHLFEQTVGITAGGEVFLRLTLHHWVNEGLMALFFLLVGLELKGNSWWESFRAEKTPALPMVAAAGGMAVPALIYVLLNPSGPAAAGWGIPMATDIAFAVGILVLLAWRVPRNVIIFLTALAIVDDLGAVLVIAIFYTRPSTGRAWVGGRRAPVPDDA
jgi:NhaA family Na+:H+ antiporter